MNIKIFITGICALLFTSCLETESQLTKPVPSEYVETTYSGFTIEQLKHVKYKIIYQFKKEIGPESSYVVEFENPEVGSSSFIVKGQIQPGETRLVVQSPELPGIALKKSYQVNLQLLSDGKIIDNQKDQVNFDVPDPMIKRLKVNLY